MEKQFEHIKQQHEKQVLGLSTSLSLAKEQLASSTREAASLQQRYERANREMADMEKRQTAELSSQRSKLQEVIDTLREERSLLQDQTQRQLREMSDKHKSAIDKLRMTMSTEQSASLELEFKRREEQCKELQQDFATRENALKQQVSDLTKDLAKTRDQLALSEQRGRCLEKQLDQICRERDDIEQKLQSEATQVQQLKGKINQLEEDVSAGEEKYRLRGEEISDLSGEHFMQQS